MRIESSFQVPADRLTTWALLMDVPRVVPCMPGATLVEEMDDSTWKASMDVKLGPIALTFASTVRREEADEAAGRVRLAVDAREARGRGSARVAIASTLAPADPGTRVDVVADLTLSGAVAQYGRGIVEDVAAQLMARFADCLAVQLAAGADAAPAPVAATPVSGGRLLLRAFANRLLRVFRRSHAAAPVE